jgi:hypothetical protein
MIKNKMLTLKKEVKMTAKAIIKQEKKKIVHNLSPQIEIGLASRKFLTAAEKDPRLKLLLLINPILAFEDAGVPLDTRARKLLRQTHPELNFENAEFYNSVKKGEIKLSWIDSIEIGSKKVKKSEQGSTRQIGKEGNQ